MGEEADYSTMFAEDTERADLERGAELRARALRLHDEQEAYSCLPANEFQ
jgi:hypothetical protein